MGNQTPFMIQRERRELLSIVPLVIMAFLFWSHDLVVWDAR